MPFFKLTNNVLCRKNFVKVLVYFEDLNYELIEEEPEIEVNTYNNFGKFLLSDIIVFCFFSNIMLNL